MTTVADSRLALLDTTIVRARLEHIEARQAWARCPSAENVRAEEQAQARVDELLERRYGMTREMAAG